MLHKERSSSSSEENPDYRCLKINVWNYVFYGFTDQSNSDQRVMLKMLQFKREHLLNMIKWRSMKIMKMSNIVTIYFLSICDSGSSLVLNCYQTIVTLLPVQCPFTCTVLGSWSSRRSGSSKSCTTTTDHRWQGWWGWWQGTKRSVKMLPAPRAGCGDGSRDRDWLLLFTTVPS